MPNIDVVVVNWNTGNYLYECVDSLRNYGSGYIKEIIVVDNNSEDESLNKIKDFKDIRIIENESNVGISKGWNIGASFSKSEYILFLNPDARIYKNTLKPCIEFFKSDADKRIGIIGVPLEDDDGIISSRCSRFPSRKNILAHALGIDYIFPKLHSSMIDFDHQTTRIVDQVIGAFFLVKRELFTILNGFDERFFVYMEEVDFSYRANINGYHSLFLAEAKAFHKGEVSSGNVKSKRLFYSLRSRLQYSRKHFSTSTIVLVSLTTIFLEPISRILKSILNLSYKDLYNTADAYRMLYLWLIRKVIK